MIIFGSKTKPKVLGGIRAACKGCKRQTEHGFVKVTEWFTLYFIPLIPLSNDLFCICGACGAKAKIEGEHKKRIMEIARSAEA